jgi:hypothetical protein
LVDQLISTLAATRKLSRDLPPAIWVLGVGSLFGIFNFVTGLALLGASVLAGVLWTAIGPIATFYDGCGFCWVNIVRTRGLRI